MRSNYRKIGEFIRLVENRNSDLKVTRLLGLSMTKEFRESTSNIVGTDMSVYRVMLKGQFACDFMSPIRVSKLPVVLKMDDEPNIVSPAYPVFEVIDIKKLDPEYLMMWFRRPEFDRYATFKCDSAIRGGYDWTELCNTDIPVPHIDKQKEIVKEYNTIVNRINLNNQLIQKLEETAQAVYRQWFVDFEFPDENGQPYKSSGGEMIESELGVIPKNSRVGVIGDILDVINGYAFTSDEFSDSGDYPIIKIANIEAPRISLQSTQYFEGEIIGSIKKCIVQTGDILISMTGSHMNQINSAVGKVGRYNHTTLSLMNQRVSKLQPKLNCKEFLYRIITNDETQKELLMGATGSANQANISPELIKSVKLVIPSDAILNCFEKLMSPLNNTMRNFEIENRYLENIRSLLLSKLATIEN